MGSILGQSNLFNPSGSPLGIQYPYSCIQFIQNLPAYNLNPGTDAMLDLIRMIQESGNYFWQGLSFPDSNTFSNGNTGVPAKTTLNGTVVVPPGTYVTSITHYSQQTDGFRFKLYDKGTSASIFYGDYSYADPVSSDMAQLGGGIGLGVQDIPFGPAYLMSPFIVTGPGVLGWEVVNNSNSANILQVLLACAVPISQRSLGHVVVAKS